MPVKTSDDISRRLRRIEGQVRGVQKMIEEDKPSSAVLQQLTAISSAIHGVGLRLVGDHYLELLASSSKLDKDMLRFRDAELMDLLERIP